MKRIYYRHYLTLDAASLVLGGWSDGPHGEKIPGENDVLLTDGGSYQFRLFGAENPPLRDDDYGVPLYRWDGEAVVKRTADEIASDIAAAKENQSRQARLAQLHSALADTDYIAAKLAEGAATREEYANRLAQRQAWRDEINRLEGSA